MTALDQIPGPDPGACPDCGKWRKAGMVHVCGAVHTTLADLSEPELIASVFVACAARTTRTGRTYDEWVSEVTERFRAAWKVIDSGSHHAR